MKKMIQLLTILCLVNVFANEPSSVVRLTSTKDVLQFVSNFLPSNPIVIEAGANDGGDTVSIARCWRKGRIYCFEPVPEHFNFLKMRTQKLRNVKPFQLALSDRNGVVTFYLSKSSANLSHVSASSSLLPPKEHLNFHPDILFPEMIDVEAITLDDFALREGIDHVDFFWLDMQGYELNMLKASALAKTARAIWLEIAFEEAYEGQYLFKDIKEWMTLNGFELVASDVNVEQPESYYGDALFVRR